MILILADDFDAHADAVEGELLSIRAPAFRLNLNIEALKATRVAFDGKLWSVEQRERCFRSPDITSVWARRLAISETLEQQFAPSTTAKKIWRGEWNRALFGLYVSLRCASWINPIQAAALADNKFYQMIIAGEVGLSTPTVVMSNDGDLLRTFARNVGTAALKFLAQDIYQSEIGEFAGIYVNKVQAADFDEFGNLSENPVLLQQYVEKSYEVRYTVVDKVHLACAIYSQESQRASVDWRRYDIPNTPHAQIEPPLHIRAAVEELMQRLQLRYGALDFIVDKGGQWHFLEVNTAGQWLWIEDLVGLPISATLAKALSTYDGGKQ